MRPPGRRPRRRLAALVAIVAILVAAAAVPAPTGAATTSTDAAMAASVRSWINRDRVARGLRPLRSDSRLATFAAERAGWMASADLMTHSSVDGTVCQGFTERGIRWYRCGEDIGWTTATWGSAAAASLYSLWRHSPDHWALLMSARFNYFGVGFAPRAANGRTYGSIVLLEGPDRTAPAVRMVSRSLSGTTIRFGWTGWDWPLQTHTAGFRDYAVSYQVDDGPIRVIRTATTLRSITLTSRARGHTYTVRIRGRDRAGNLSRWSTGSSLRVP